MIIIIIIMRERLK